MTRNADGEGVPAFSALNPSNSFALPATFVLKMEHPLILCQAFAQQIQAITGEEVGSWDQPEYLVSALVKASKKANHPDGEEVAGRKALRVTLPDEQHSYYVTESEETGMKCSSVSSISFSHPSHAPQILAVLRRQALLNALITSCIRPQSQQADSGSSLTFEISSISLDHLSIAFEHPQMEQMCSAEVDLGPDPTGLHCSLYGAEEDGVATDEYATRVLQRCLSIPVTMRAILRLVSPFVFAPFEICGILISLFALDADVFLKVVQWDDGPQRHLRATLPVPSERRAGLVPPDFQWILRLPDLLRWSNQRRGL